MPATSVVAERPQIAACELFLARFLTRLGLRISPRLLVLLLLSVTLGIALITVAAVRAWGDAAAVAVRETTGFFNHRPMDLTNAVHLIFLIALPAIVLTLFSLAELLGMSRIEPDVLRREQAIWTSFRFRIKDILVSDQILPRIMFQLLAAIPLTLALGFPSLTASERKLVALMLGIWLALELLRLAVASWRLTRQPRPAPGRATGMIIISSVAVGVSLGGVILLLWPMLMRGSTRQGATVVAITTALISYSGIAWAIAGLISIIGLALVVPLLMGKRTFGQIILTDKPHHSGLLVRILPHLFPVTSPQAILAAWRAPEVCAALLFTSALVVVQPRLIGPAATSLSIIATTGFMAFAVTRLTPQGAAASLRRLRHHYEQRGSGPVSLVLLLGIMSIVKALPFAATTVLLAHLAAMPLSAALAIPIIVLGATLVAESRIATATGEALTERQLMLLAFFQAAGCMPGWAIVNYSTALGWLYAFFVLGVFTWLYTQRLTIWRPRTRW